MSDELTLAWIMGRSPSIRVVEVRGAELTALAQLGARGRVVLVKDGKPVAAVVGAEDLGFLLDADRDLAEAEMEDEATPPPPSSGKVKKFEH